MRLFLPTIFLLILAATLGCQSTVGPSAKSTARQIKIDSASFKEKLAQAEKGDAAAQFDAGKCYAAGRGVSRDQAEAVKWFRKAAEQGNAKAQTALGWAYFRGQGVAEDNEEGLKWFNKAADQGDADAKLLLLGLAMEAGNYADAVKELRKTCGTRQLVSPDLAGHHLCSRAGKNQGRCRSL